LDLGI